LAHHDPLRSDDAMDRIVEKLKAGLSADRSLLLVSAAVEGNVIDVKPSDVGLSLSAGEEFGALT
jgi:hypothetical protein